MASDEFRAYQAQMAAAMAAAPQPTALAERRQRMEEAMSRLPLADGVRATSLNADGVTIVSCIPEESPDEPALLYFHGGGYRLGSAATYRSYGSYLARACTVRVLLVDYRLAPEHPFPAAIDDAVSAYRWLLDQGGPSEQIVVGGDSAGGGLAAALALRANEEGLPLPSGVVCLSPWADLTNGAESYVRCAPTDALFSKMSADEAAGLYLAGANPAQPYVSPIRGDWSGLPPLLIQASDCEVLTDDAVALAENARTAGVDVELHLYPEMPHVWQLNYPRFPEAVEAVDQISAFVARVTSRRSDKDSVSDRDSVVRSPRFATEPPVDIPGGPS
jgi:epsilon-lactone hydrolase